MKKLSAAVLVVALVLGLAACGPKSKSAQVIQKDQATSAQILGKFEASQPAPVFSYSQLRQTLIEVETAQANTTSTTSFFFNQGVTDPVQSCPSVGFPIASTSEITNPSQVVQKTGTNNDFTEVLPQIDPNGIYAGMSTGTYVLCLNAQGQAYANYWEGFVQTVTGPATWNKATHNVELTGPPSFTFTVHK